MTLRSLERTQAAIEAVQQATEKIEHACRSAASAFENLPEDLRDDAVDEIRMLVMEWLGLNGTKPPNLARNLPPPTSTQKSRTTYLPSVSEAIISYLKTLGAGASQEQIIAGIQGNFHSTSANPDRLIQSTLSQLKIRGRLILNKNGLYFIAADYDDSEAHDDIRHRIGEKSDVSD